MLKEWRLQLKEMKHYFIAAAAVFAAGIVLGYTDTDRFLFFLQSQTDHLKSIVDQVDRIGWGWFGLAGIIFANNLLVSLLMLYGGGFFAILPLFSLVTNGLVIGYLARTYVPDHGWGGFLLGILPHGVIEIPAVLFASAYGIRFGTYVAKTIVLLPFQRRRIENGKRMFSFLRSTLPASMVLALVLLIAAVVESTLTHSLVK